MTWILEFLRPCYEDNFTVKTVLLEVPLPFIGNFCFFRTIINGYGNSNDNDNGNGNNLQQNEGFTIFIFDFILFFTDLFKILDSQSGRH